MATRDEAEYSNPFVRRIPPRAWDSHMHVINTAAYPLPAESPYKLHATADDANEFESSVGIANMVLVQPSAYGYDNNCMLDAMRSLGPDRSRGVVVFDPDVTPLTTLEEWRGLGVRGVRINLQSVGKSLGFGEMAAALSKYDKVIHSLGWIIQIYIPMHMMDLMEPLVSQLRVRVCIDHMGQPDVRGTELYQRTKNPYHLPGFAAMIRLLEGGKTFVKLSAAYRICDTDHGFDDIAPVAKEIMRVAGRKRVVFATDWPHTRFDGFDIRPWMEAVLDWCGDDLELINRIFRDNAEDLWSIT